MCVNLDATHNCDTKLPHGRNTEPPSGRLTDRRSAILQHTLKGLSTKHNQYFLVRDLKKNCSSLVVGCNLRSVWTGSHIVAPYP